MATKRYRKVNKNKEITYEDLKNFNNDPNLSKYFLGGILDNNDTENAPQTTQNQGDSNNLLNNTSQTNGVGKAFSSAPIIGAFASLGTSIGGALTQRDEYGIAQGSKGAQAVGNFIDPVTVAQDLAKEGKYGQAALSALIPGAGSIFGARLNKRKKQRLEVAKTNQRISETAQRELSQLEDTPTYGGVMRNGGTLNYGGQLHEGPNGGVPVDAMGNPNQLNPVALVEKGEVSYNTPDGGTYIYSDSLKLNKNKTFAKQAKNIQSRYKFRMKDGVITDSISKKAYDSEMQDLLSKQEKLRSIVTPQEQPMMRTGGNLPKYDRKTPTLGNTSFLNFNPEASFNPWQPKGLDHKTLMQNYYRDNSTTKFSTPLDGSKLSPLVKPIDNTAAMDEFVKQVEMDYSSRLIPKTANIPTKGVSAQLPKIKPYDSNRQLYQGMNWAETGLAAAASTNNWSMQLPKQNTNPDFSINTQMLPFDQYSFGYNNVPNTFVGNATSKVAKIPVANKKLYQGMNWAETGLAAAAPVLGGITGMILEGTNKTRPEKLSLSRMTPQQISLERRRRAARESAGVATSNLTRSLRNAAPTAGSYMSNVVAGITDIDRNLSNQLGESYTQEELQNAQLRQQADQVNADLAMQEAMYNTEAANQFDAGRKARMNAYLSQIGQGVTSALNQKFQSSRDADFLNMQNPDYAMAVTGKGLRRRKMILPRTQIGG